MKICTLWSWNTSWVRIYGALRLGNIQNNISSSVGNYFPPPSPKKKKGILEWLLLYWQYNENMYALIIEHQLCEGFFGCKAGKYPKEIVLPPWETIAPVPASKKREERWNDFFFIDHVVKICTLWSLNISWMRVREAVRLGNIQKK